jgi:hypothetical protein
MSSCQILKCKDTLSEQTIAGLFGGYVLVQGPVSCELEHGITAVSSGSLETLEDDTCWSKHVTDFIVQDP